MGSFTSDLDYISIKTGRHCILMIAIQSFKLNIYGYTLMHHTANEAVHELFYFTWCIFPCTQNMTKDLIGLLAGA